MLEPNLSAFDVAAFRKTFRLTGNILAVDAPPTLTRLLGLSRTACVSREGWRSWLPHLGKARIVLLWSSPRREDDQEFLGTLARHLPASAFLWSFHPLGVLTVDRLTGDAVQLLLTTAGLRDMSCENARFGFYARGYCRRKGSKPEPFPDRGRIKEIKNGEIDTLTGHDRKSLRTKSSSHRKFSSQKPPLSLSRITSDPAKAKSGEIKMVAQKRRLRTKPAPSAMKRVKSGKSSRKSR